MPPCLRLVTLAVVVLSRAGQDAPRTDPFHDWEFAPHTAFARTVVLSPTLLPEGTGGVGSVAGNTLVIVGARLSGGPFGRAIPQRGHHTLTVTAPGLCFSACSPALGMSQLLSCGRCAGAAGVCLVVLVPTISFTTSALSFSPCVY